MNPDGSTRIGLRHPDGTRETIILPPDDSVVATFGLSGGTLRALNRLRGVVLRAFEAPGGRIEETGHAGLYHVGAIIVKGGEGEIILRGDALNVGEREEVFRLSASVVDRRDREWTWPKFASVERAPRDFTHVLLGSKVDAITWRRDLGYVDERAQRSHVVVDSAVLLQNSAENQLLIEVPNDPLEHTLPLELLVSTDPAMTGECRATQPMGQTVAQVKRFRGTGGDHAGMDPPLVLEPRKPGSRPKRGRNPEPWELPNGYK